MAVGVEELTNGRQIGHEQIMNQIDVKRSASDILKTGTYQSIFSDVLLVMAEVHKDNGQQSESGNGQRQHGPLHSQDMPLQRIEGGKDDNDDNNRVEPLGVHQSLEALPIAMHHIAIDKEGEIHEQLA